MTEPNKVQQNGAVDTARRFTEQVPHNSDLGMQVVSVDGSKGVYASSPTGMDVRRCRKKGSKHEYFVFTS